MLAIACPNCGPRPTEEFRFGGELPGVPDWVVDADDRIVDYIWFSDNLDGPSQERWFHDGGCRRWFNVVRDTATDRVV